MSEGGESCWAVRSQECAARGSDEEVSLPLLSRPTHMQWPESMLAIGTELRGGALLLGPVCSRGGTGIAVCSLGVWP